MSARLSRDTVERSSFPPIGIEREGGTWKGRIRGEKSTRKVQDEGGNRFMMGNVDEHPRVFMGGHSASLQPTGPGPAGPGDGRERVDGRINGMTRMI